MNEVFPSKARTTIAGRQLQLSESELFAAGVLSRGSWKK